MLSVAAAETDSHPARWREPTQDSQPLKLIELLSILAPPRVPADGPLSMAAPQAALKHCLPLLFA